ncbi:RraA family protein [Sphingomonas sp. GB1N7]|uniref:RraA family protein n=1 Tax=Parasphingomonas caseinilytica TaxID=3096158 RepID=UPI002FCC91FF
MDPAMTPGGSLSSASLHEAAGRIGALPSHIKPVSPLMRVHGRALPVRCPPGDNLWIHKALDKAHPGDVLVVDCGPGDEFGYWGEIMATAAITRGIAGLIITGGVRDSLELISLGLPTFAGRVCVMGTGKNPQGDGSVGEPVRIGAITIRKGDLIVGDADGVMALSPAVAAWAVPAAHDRDTKEKTIIAQIKAGASTLEVYNL